MYRFRHLLNTEYCNVEVLSHDSRGFEELAAFSSLMMMTIFEWRTLQVFPCGFYPAYENQLSIGGRVL
jgi:hypothetical protein